MDIVICEETVLYFHCNIKVQELMTRPAKTVTFKFIDPTDALVRLLLLSPLAANEDNLSFVPKDGLYYADFHDGARMRRIHEELPAGAVALTSVRHQTPPAGRHLFDWLKSLDMFCHFKGKKCSYVFAQIGTKKSYVFS